MTFTLALEHLKQGEKVRRREWSPSMHLSMLKNGHVVITFVDGKTGLWVYNPKELKKADWETYVD